MQRLEKGETKDLYDHFCQPWFGAFCVNEWESFLLELQDFYKSYVRLNKRYKAKLNFYSIIYSYARILEKGKELLILFEIM